MKSSNPKYFDIGGPMPNELAIFSKEYYFIVYTNMTIGSFF